MAKGGNGEAAWINLWKIEAMSYLRLQLFAFMQPGEAFLVVGHSLATICSTATDIATYHRKMVLFIGDRKQTQECISDILPLQKAF